MRCNWDLREITDRIQALGLLDLVSPMKMQAYSNQVGREFQGFAYVKFTKSSLPAPAAKLLGNSPNPFNPVTKIKFAVSKSGNYAVRLYNVQGALIRTVANGHFDAGTHEAMWDGRMNSGGKAASGVYYAKISGAAKNSGSDGIKLVLAK
jgi:flagellar hook assembly protein FlgD